jgi:hypothetical protein
MYYIEIRYLNLSQIFVTIFCLFKTLKAEENTLLIQHLNNLTIDNIYIFVW